MNSSSEPAILKNKELSGLINASIGLIDLSFDTLIELQEKQINWQNVEGIYSTFVENNNPTRQTLLPLNLDFSKVSLAVKRQSPSEASKETYEILKTIYSYFSSLSTKDGSKEISQDFQTATELVLAYLLLNEVLLGKVVGDKENLEESIILESVLQNLSVEDNFRVNIDELRDSINKVGLESDKKSVIEHTRELFKEQLKRLTGFEEITQGERQFEFFIKPQLPIAEPKEIETVSELKRQKRLQLHISTAALSKLKHFLVTGPLWYWFTITFSVLIGVVIFLIPANVYPLSLIRNVFGLILVYWLPGFAFVKAVFPASVPTKVQSSSLEAIERLALSIGVSIALTPIIGLIFYYTPLGVNTPFIPLSLIALTIIFATLASLREMRTKTISQKPIITLS